MTQASRACRYNDEGNALVECRTLRININAYTNGSTPFSLFAQAFACKCEYLRVDDRKKGLKSCNDLHTDSWRNKAAQFSLVGFSNFGFGRYYSRDGRNDAHSNLRSFCLSR